MTGPIFLLFHVDDPAVSAAFYEALLKRSPVERSPTFALFALKSDLMLGLWSRHGVEPAAAPAIGGMELAFSRASPAEVDETHAEWSGRGLPILQAPTDMDFGRTFVAADPDGHRLRVFAPAQA